MNDLEEIRVKIDSIDKELMSLFCQRMNLVKEVIAYKKANNLPILDAKREDKVIDKNLSLVKEDLKPYALEWIKSMLKVSKDYQNE